MSMSADWVVDEWGSADGFGKVRQQFASVREILEDEALCALRNPQVSGWSCGEHAGHLALVTARMAGAIVKGLDNPGLDSDQQLPETTRVLLEHGVSPRGIAQAPEAVRPDGYVRTELLDTLSASERLWHQLETRRGEIDGCHSRVEHPRLGFMTPREWLRLCSIHTAHHLDIVRDIRGGATPRDIG